jgi:2,4-dienoyl-CoA reductase-like NADH-dependent reductase (Old Yellow Enzyme family)
MALISYMFQPAAMFTTHPGKATPGLQVPFATAIRKETGIMTTAVGLITEPEQANHIIQTGEADAGLHGTRVPCAIHVFLCMRLKNLV